MTAMDDVVVSRVVTTGQSGFVRPTLGDSARYAISPQADIRAAVGNPGQDGNLDLLIAGAKTGTMVSHLRPTPKPMNHRLKAVTHGTPLEIDATTAFVVSLGALGHAIRGRHDATKTPITRAEVGRYLMSEVLERP